MKRTFLSLATLFTGLAVSAFAQGDSVPQGTKITVRTNEAIHIRSANGQIYNAQVNGDVRDNSGRVVIPSGANAELEVRPVGNNEMSVDLDSITINGRRYAVTASEQIRNQRQGLGKNKRTGEFVGGGALLGTILGAVAGGGKGAAIGALAGGAAGAGTQVLTRGKSVNVPAESLLTFRLEQPLNVGIRDNGYDRNGHHYHRVR